ncbi:MAG: polynucleotide adenylyltransferase PcnB [Gammaproteobacteria bacterium]|nr:polynucleotide adenylyltransferase PcnB [Gammaproteobacteria bacterium]
MSQQEPQKQIIERPDHGISRQSISENALKVLYRLHKAGFDAHLVGGGVRDLLLGHEPKDFDIATNARPEEVRDLFRNSRLIGRRFKLVHVRFGRDIIEVATFRANREDSEHPEQHLDDSGRILRDNVYGSMGEDAIRRDFTVNALYYNIADFSVVDFVDGVADLKAGLLRLIGDPETRYREDPVRMIRAVRFATKLGFRIEEKTAQPIRELANLLEDIPAARLFEEVLKLFLGGRAAETLEMLRHYRLFRPMFRLTDEAIEASDKASALNFLSMGLGNTDARIEDGKPVTPFFLFAVLLWEPVRQRYEALQEEGVSPAEAMQVAADEVAGKQQQFVSIPRRFSTPMREVWQLQTRFQTRSGKRALRLLGHPRFRAAYDFLLLRAENGEIEQEVADFWTEFQEADASRQQQMISELGNRPGGKEADDGSAAKSGRRRRRGGRRRRRKSGGSPKADDKD